MAYDESVETNSGGDGFDTDDDRLNKKFDTWDKDLREVWSRWREEARLCYDMVSGDQWDDVSKAELEEQLIAPISWNRTQPLVDAVSGAQIGNRHETKFYPREMGDVGLAELVTAAAEWVADEGDFEDEESDAFYDTLICGLGWTDLIMDYEEAPEGDIRKNRIDPIEMSADVSAKKRNLADASYIRRVRSFTKEQFRERFPDWADTIGSASDPYDNASKGHSDSSDDYEIDDRELYGDKRKQGDVYVSEYQWYELESYYRVIDPATQQETELSEEGYDRISQKFLGFGMDLDGVKAKRRVYYRAFRAADYILEHDELPDGAFTYHCITGKRDRNNGIWYGLVRAMIDPQKWANKWMTQILVIINKNAKGGIMVEEDASDDMRQLEDDWAKPDSIAVFKDGALASAKVQPKPTAPYPEGMDRMIQMAISSIRDVTGINQELLGMADKNQPGIVEAQRREAGYAMLAQFFDSLRRYRKISGRLLLKYIQNYVSDGRLIRIIGQEGQVRNVPLLREETAGDYDLIIDESPSSPNQKEKVWAMLVQVMPILRTAPLPPQVWAELIRYSPLPETITEKIIKAITAPPPPEQVQAQQQKQQLMLANAMAEIKKTQSEVTENVADAELTKRKANHQLVETMLTQMLGEKVASGDQSQLNVNT